MRLIVESFTGVTGDDIELEAPATGLYAQDTVILNKKPQ